MSRAVAGAAAAVLGAVILAACGSRSAPPRSTVTLGGTGAPIPRRLLAELRPIGRGPRFRPALSGTPGRPCTPVLGRRDQAHVELFAANRVMLLSAGIGTRPPRSLLDRRVTRAGCFGAVVTLDPTGTVYFRPGTRPTLGSLFTAWGPRLGSMLMASFHGRVRVYIGGRRNRAPAASVRLAPDAEIVLEVGPYVPPHNHFTFTRVPPATLR